MYSTSGLDELFQILNSIEGLKGFTLRQPQWSNTTVSKNERFGRKGWTRVHPWQNDTRKWHILSFTFKGSNIWLYFALADPDAPLIGSNSFVFRVHFCQKVPVSEVGDPKGKSWIRHCFILLSLYRSETRQMQDLRRGFFQQRWKNCVCLNLFVYSGPTMSGRKKQSKVPPEVCRVSGHNSSCTRIGASSRNCTSSRICSSSKTWSETISTGKCLTSDGK